MAAAQHRLTMTNLALSVTKKNNPRAVKTKMTGRAYSLNFWKKAISGGKITKITIINWIKMSGIKTVFLLKNFLIKNK